MCFDPDLILPDQSRQDFRHALSLFDDVFDPNIPRYNGACGPTTAVVNMGTVRPPYYKGRQPQYGREKGIKLQEKI